LAVVTVKAVDAAGHMVPAADNEIAFGVQGPARIIGVGNGDPVSHEADQYVGRVVSIPVTNIHRSKENGEAFDDADTSVSTIVSTGDIELPDVPDSGRFRFFYKSIGTQQVVYLNGQLLGRPDDGSVRSEFPVDRGILHAGSNVLKIVARPFRKRFMWDELNHDPGVLQLAVPAGQWKRRLFNGLEQVIVETTGEPGAVVLTAGSAGLEPASLTIRHQVRLPKVFGDNMVLQRDIPIPVWGWASPGAAVSAKLGKAVVVTKADREGKWMVHFPKMAAGGPYSLRVWEEGSIVELKNILIGDVWLASGQSNMEFEVRQAKNAAREISDASYPDIRCLIVDHGIKLTPQTDISTAGWEMADSIHVKRFSAVAYFFARKIHADQHVPIGIIQSTWGGTPVQAWTSREMLLSSTITKNAALANDTLTENNFLQDSLNQGSYWDIVHHSQNGADKRISLPAYNDSGWARVEMPRLIKDFGIGYYEGIMWLRKKIVLPDAFAGKSLTINLGHPEMNYSLYFNGVKICEDVWNGAPRQSYTIPAGILRKGENTIAIRMGMLWGGGGMNAPAEDIYLSDGDVRVSLAGEWRYKKDLEPLPHIHTYQYYPDVLFNAMVNPLIPYGITGFLWYQGEANDYEAYNYRKMFPMMITDWRQRWGRGDLPFLFVQLANFKSRKPLPAESEWAELREAQAMTLAQPQTAMACAIDLGEGDNIHPADKQDVGLRLALGAERLVYKRPGIASGPLYKGFMVEGDRVRVRFSSVGSGFKTNDGKAITGFTIAGADRQFYWADAVVAGDEIIVHSDKVSRPLAVRYAWADNPECNLVNVEGLPAVPFRTDDWPGITQPAPPGVSLVSPNGAIAASVGLDRQGQIFYSVSYTKGPATVKAVSHGDLGIVRKDADFSAELSFVGVVSERKIVDAYRLMHGKRRDCRNAAVEKILRFRNGSGGLVDVVFRAYDDGVAFRYEFPRAAGDSCRVTGERTSFVIPEGTERWMQQYTNTYEALYPAATTGKADAPDHQQWGFPALYKVQDKPVWVLISEAGVSRQNCASRLSNKQDETVYRVTMPEDEVSGGYHWKSAWRVIMIGSLNDVVQSTLVTDVSEPSKETDTGWIRPGPVAWVYWAFNHGSKDYRKIVEYVDLAVAMHWPYVLIDWEWDRMGNGGNIEDAVAYARSKGIKPLMWYNSRDSLHSGVGLDPYGRLSTHAAREQEFAWLNKIGVYGVKVDFFEDDRQKEMAYYLDLLEDAAKYHLMVDFHGATIPKGWERTYPNLMTMEAVYGAEWYGYAPVLTKLGAVHNATLPFTRNVVGSMDYTPVTFTDIGFPHTTTYAHELALSVVFESGLQHFADRPEGYSALPDAERRFLMTVPVAWDDTRLIDGFPGERVVMARRSGRLWYIGGLNGEDRPQDMELHFDFLGDGMYDLELMGDGGTGKAFRDTTMTVRKGSVVPVNCLARGGFVARLAPASKDKSRQ
jgi:sialate O-acetylesterase